MLMGPPPTKHPPPGLRQDDSAQIIPLIVSTCVDSQLGPSFPQTRMTGSLRAADRQRDPLSLKWNVDFQALLLFLINPVSSSLFFCSSSSVSHAWLSMVFMKVLA